MASREARRERIASELIGSSGVLTDHALAQVLGCSHHTVAAARSALINSGQLQPTSERLEPSGRLARGRRPGTRPTTKPESPQQLFERLLAEGVARGFTDPVRWAEGLARRSQRSSP
jgi:hypothetical protein